MKRKLTIAGLFAGIGGLDAGVADGLEDEGFDVEHVALVEREPFPQRVLAARFPGVPIFDDVREVSGAELGEVDVLVGGFPCQGMSGANKSALGLADPRAACGASSSASSAKRAPASPSSKTSRA